MSATLLLILISVFFTSILSGVLGMAGGMVLMGILLWLVPVQQAMILHAIAQFFANGSRAFIHREHIVWRCLPPYFIGMALVLVLAILVSFIPDKRLVLIILGLMPFAAYAIPKKWALDFLKPTHGFFCGAAVTVAHVTAGVSGPLLDVFFQSQSMTRHQNVATKALTQATSHIAKFLYFGFFVGNAAVAFENLTVLFCLATMLIAVAGTTLSRHILSRISDRQFYRVTQIVLFAVGAVYLGQAVFYKPETPPITTPVVMTGAAWVQDIQPAWLVLPSSYRPDAATLDPARLTGGSVQIVLIGLDDQAQLAGLQPAAHQLSTQGIRSVFIVHAKTPVNGDDVITVPQTERCALQKALLETVLERKSLRGIFDASALAWQTKNTPACD